jgi:NADPH:quinone reductase-like Zn-dependent oxidoreductase
MKAAVYTQYGPPEVLHVTEVPKPVPKRNEMLVKIKATAVNSGDWRLRKADPYAVRFIFGLTKPRIHILGTVFSGEVEAIGEGVKSFKVGDSVFGHTDMTLGSYAEYKCIPEDGSVAIKPSEISHAQAAVIPFGAVTALHFLKKANVKPGQKVIIIGASGAVGSAAVQLAKSFGAIVTGVCSTANVELVKSIGADNVIDYTKQDFTQSGEMFDVIFDTVNTISVPNALKVLAQNGVMILSAAGMSEMFQALWFSTTGNRRILTGVISHTAADIIFLKQLVETGRFKPIIDRTYPIEKIAEAHAYVEKGHKKGNVAIEV